MSSPFPPKARFWEAEENPMATHAECMRVATPVSDFPVGAMPHPQPVLLCPGKETKWAGCHTTSQVLFQTQCLPRFWAPWVAVFCLGKPIYLQPQCSAVSLCCSSAACSSRQNNCYRSSKSFSKFQSYREFRKEARSLSTWEWRLLRLFGGSQPPGVPGLLFICFWFLVPLQENCLFTPLDWATVQSRE